ncbi:MAG: MarR family transcriptional regulator [Planctomycetes bacterium]|nr:MarR family transcriptional regulator [Planctomycetota bacterium]
MKRATTTQEAIQQTRPFRSAGQEAVVALFLASEALKNRVAKVLAARDDITLQQYNVLRILRGAGAEGLPTLDIVERMIEQTPGITRLIDRLEGKCFVERYRLERDRRQVWCRLTAEGAALLADLDAPMDALDSTALDCLSARELATLIGLLARIRNHQPEA